MWNFHFADDLDCERERLFGRAAATLRPKVASRLPQFSQHLRSIETLALAVFAEAHDWP
jgi:hypothetical protein